MNRCHRCWRDTRRAFVSVLPLLLLSPPAIGHESPSDVSPASALADSWAVYTIEIGAHFPHVSNAQPGNPRDGLRMVAGRDYGFRLNPSAIYQIDHPVQPGDQFDWNKLPGFSDCGTVDLAVNGAMFGWRWRLDTTPKVLEVTAYANNDRVHLTPATPLFTLDADDLLSDAPLRYRVWIDGSQYRFSVVGEVRGRAIDVSATLPRVCPAYAANGLRWSAGFYFGGTSTAPSQITGRIAEVVFAP